jgi:PAS domain S-box-containing protein
LFDDQENQETLLLQEQVRILYTGIPNSLLANLFGAYIAMYIFSGIVAPERLLVWVGAMIIVSIGRFISHRLYMKSTPDPEQAYNWYLQFMLGVGLMALAVGSSGYLLFVFDDVSLQVTLALMIACIASFATTTLSPRLEISIPFQVIIFVPILVSLFVRQTTEAEHMFWMMGALCILLCLSGFRIFQTIRHSTLLTLEAEYREEELRKSQQRLGLFIKDTPMAVIEWDVDGRAVAWNPAAERMFLYSEEEALGKRGQDLIVPVDAVPNAQDTWMALMSDTGGYHFIEQTIRKDGGSLICEWFNTPLVSQKSKVIGAISLIQDITLEMENERLKREFVSIVSHELRTPVTSIKGSLGLLAAGVLKDNPEKSQEMLDIAVKNTDRLQLLINDILDVEKLDSGKIEYHYKETDLSKLIQDVIQANESYAEKYNIKVITGVMPETCLVKIDPDRIFQVITNLLSNAIKFSSAEATVTLSAHALKKGQFRIMVNNMGTVIPISEKTRLFSKFYQTDSTDKRAKEGSGLGLYISQKILEQHKSKMDFNSSEEEGTSFFFDLGNTEEDTAETA